MITGSCLCGQISFTLHGALTAPRYCHCTNCRKFSGTSPAAWAMANSAELQTQTQGDISEFNSGRGIRCFCSSCGSPVWFKSLDFPAIVGIPLGVLDQGAVPAPQMHLWFSSKPDWCEILDNKPKHAEGPP